MTTETTTTQITIPFCSMNACRYPAKPCHTCQPCRTCDECASAQPCSRPQMCEMVRLTGRHRDYGRRKNECVPCETHPDTCANWCNFFGACWQAPFAPIREARELAERAARADIRAEQERQRNMEFCVFCQENEKYDYVTHKVDGEQLPRCWDCVELWDEYEDTDEFDAPTYDDLDAAAAVA